MENMENTVEHKISLDEFRQIKSELLREREGMERQHQIYFKCSGCGSIDLEFRGKRIEWAYEVFYAVRADYKDHIAQRLGFWLVQEDTSQDVYAALEARRLQREKEATFYAGYYDVPMEEVGIEAPVRILHYDHKGKCYRYHDTGEIHWQIIAD